MKHLLFFTFFAVVTAEGASVSPTPRQNTVLSKNSAPSGIVGTLVNVSCYGTNNRGTTNPMSPDSRIFLRIKGAVGSTLIDFPSKITAPMGLTPSGVVGSCGVTKLPNNKVRYNGIDNDLDLDIIASANTGGQLMSDALNIENLNNNNNRSSVECSESPVVFSENGLIPEKAKIEAIQVFPTATKFGTAFYGYNGTMDRGAKLGEILSTKGGSSAGFYSGPFTKFNIALPGQDGFCGGFHSPLMFFFDEQYPTFEGKSELLRGKEQPTSWVENNHQGHFLVQLKNSKSEIFANNLFGDTAEFSNGFEALKALDSNKDKIINNKDKLFNNLYLWRDLNGNSRNDDGEIKSLKDFKIISIDLKYNEGYRAERNRTVFKGRSTFHYSDSKGVMKVGDLFDVYFQDADISK